MPSSLYVQVCGEHVFLSLCVVFDGVCACVWMCVLCECVYVFACVVVCFFVVCVCCVLCVLVLTF